MTKPADRTTFETDKDALEARLADLRAFAEDIAAHVQTLDLPETYLEAERGARAVTTMDRLMSGFYDKQLLGYERKSRSTRRPAPAPSCAPSPIS